MIDTERLDELISEVVEDGSGGDSSEGGRLTRMGRALSRGMGRWCETHPLLCIVAGFGLLVLGGLLFLAATGQRSLRVAILLALAAPLIGAFGLLILNEPISRYARENPSRGRWIGILGLAAGAGLVWLAIVRRSPTLAVVGAVVALLALLAINARLLAGASQYPGLLLLAGLTLLLVAPVLAWIGDGVDRWSIGAVVPWVVGLVLFKVGLPPWIDRQRDTRRVAITVDSVLAVGLGVLLLLQASREFSEGALLFGLVLVVAGLSALGISIARFDPSRGRSVLVLLVGLLAVGFGGLLANGIIGLESTTLVAVLVIGAVGAWFVFRGEALIAVLLLGFLVGWVLVDRVSDEPQDPSPGSALTVLSLGDSFISGEGAAEFFEGTNRAGPNGNQCRRAPTAYPYLVAARLDADLIFLACSGAKATAIDNLPQEGQELHWFPEIAGTEDQVRRLLAVHGSQIDDIGVVLVSMGGNDVGFATVIKACLLPQSCAIAELTEPWLRNVVESRKQLVASYLAIKEAVGAGTPVVAVLYPLIVEPSESCDLAIDAAEIDFVVRFTDALNETVRVSAAAAGINVFEGSVDAFAGRRLCDPDPATNFFHLAPTDGPIQETIVPPNWVHGTLHPRADGHELIANRLVGDDDQDRQGYLVELLNSVEAGGPANPAPEGGPAPGVPDYEDLPDEEWVEEQLYRTVDDLLLPVGLLLFGGLITAFGVIKARIPFLRFLNPSNN